MSQGGLSAPSGDSVIGLRLRKGTVFGTRADLNRAEPSGDLYPRHIIKGGNLVKDKVKLCIKAIVTRG